MADYHDFDNKPQLAMPLTHNDVNDNERFQEAQQIVDTLRSKRTVVKCIFWPIQAILGLMIFAGFVGLVASLITK